MAKVGFRREVLGFNRQDVIDYIRKAQQDSSLREKELIDTLDKLNRRNSQLIDELKKIPELEAKLKISEATVDKLASEAEALEEKKAEAEAVSRDIAKMYLVAKSNAEAVKKSTKESSELAFYEVNETISSIEKIHNELDEIKQRVTEASENYCKDLEMLTASLSNAKTTINSVSKKASEVTEAVEIKRNV